MGNVWLTEVKMNHCVKEKIGISTNVWAVVTKENVIGVLRKLLYAKNKIMTGINLYQQLSKIKQQLPILKKMKRNQHNQPKSLKNKMQKMSSMLALRKRKNQQLLLLKKKHPLK